MKKKLLVLFILLFLFGIKINAETTTETCIDNKAGNVEIQWTNNKTDTGYIYTKSCDRVKKDEFYFSIDGQTLIYYKSEKDALDACEKDRKIKCPESSATDKSEGVYSNCDPCEIVKVDSCKIGTNGKIVYNDSFNDLRNVVALQNERLNVSKYSVDSKIYSKIMTNITVDPGYGGSSSGSSSSSNKYTLTYNLNGGSGYCLPTTVNKGQKWTISCNPTRSNYVLGGWSSSPTGGSLIYTGLTATRNLTAYAIWIPSYTCAKNQYVNESACNNNKSNSQFCMSIDGMCYFKVCNSERTTDPCYGNKKSSCLKDGNGCYYKPSGDCSTVYGWSFYKHTSMIDPKGSCDNAGTKAVKSAEYKITTGVNSSSGDTAYCLQPGNLGPTVAQTYVLDKTFDVSVCRDSLHHKDGTNDFRCGLAHILYQTVTYDSKTETYVSNGKYNYSSITYALRLWMAQFSNNISLGNVLNYGDEFETIDWVTKDDYYKATADAIVNGTYPSDGKIGKDKPNIIGCGLNGGNCDILKSVELFRSAYNASKDSKLFLNGIDFSKDVPITRYYQTTRDEGETIVTIPESIQKIRDIKLDCTQEEYKSGKCDVSIKYFDENDREITNDVVVSGYCKKESCHIKTTATKTCKEITNPTGTGKWKIKVYINKWQRNNGYVRFYTHATNPASYQKFITFAFNLEKCESVSEEMLPPETTVRIECPCDDNSKCTDLSNKNNLTNSCKENEELTSAKTSDPNMNCILNACYSYEKNEYDNSSKYNVNTDVCRVYCRDELEFYTPGIVSVYAGMQFQFDLGNTLKNKGIISKTYVDNKTNVPKLTSIIIHKKQCTSEINYNNWKTEYDKKLNNMVNSYNSGNTSLYNANKQQLDQWIYDLENCNLYTSSELSVSGINHAINNSTSKDYILNEVTCDKDNCLKLDLSYEDEKYGSERTLEKETGVVSNESNKTYYCKNSASTVCYEYKKDKSVEINEGNYNSNSLATINYKECSNGSCKDKSIKVPNNDYATFVSTNESDFYQNKKYQVETYTGAVSEGDGSDNTHTRVADYSYPVSNSVKSGTYGITYNFSNIPVKNLTNYSYSCKYKVYNTTVLYDCAVKNDDGTVDLSKCNNSCYEVKDGIPIIKDECMNWETKDTKQYGFIYRSVDLKNLFPNAVIDENGISTRNIGINWSNQLKTIEKIEETGDSVFTDGKYLDYRFTLTPQTIKAIKSYNKEQSSKGGYTNNTLEKCDKELVGNVYIFKNCKSSFLSEIRNYPGIQISGNKAGGN